MSRSPAVGEGTTTGEAGQCHALSPQGGELPHEEAVLVSEAQATAQYMGLLLITLVMAAMQVPSTVKEMSRIRFWHFVLSK